jgi:Protein of unknown function (DUF998)
VLRTTALAGLAAFAGIVVLEHLLVPGLAPARHMISEYANARAGALMTAGFLAWALSLVATAVLVRAHPALCAPLLLAAVGVFVTACFATQTSGGALSPGVHRSTAGRLHDLGSGLVILALLGAVVASIVLVRAPTAFRLRAGALLLLAVVTSATLLATGDHVPGVRQRVLVAVGCAWQALLLQALTRRPPRCSGSTS